MSFDRVASGPAGGFAKFSYSYENCNHISNRFFLACGIIVLAMLVKITDVETGLDVLKTFAPATSGIVGIIVGYYFGKREKKSQV